ncbi:hypothetical protein PUR23_19630 [Methylorubrum populi]|uniref:hypothetical protein n=1 Tax=Methylorubrum populi TaxID=223967 RepID=UPI0031F8BCBE
MRPVTYRFRFPAAGTISLGAILHGRDVRTGAVVRLPQPGVTIEWNIEWPDGAVAMTQVQSDGLAVDPRTSAVFYPLTPDREAQIRAGAPIPYRIRILMSDGFEFPVLVGDIGMER